MTKHLNLWMSEGSCAGKTQLFFGSSTERAPDRRKREREAKLICSTCPVFHQCRQYISTHPEYGIWSGLTEDERERMGYPMPSASLRKRNSRRRKIINVIEQD